MPTRTTRRAAPDAAPLLLKPHTGAFSVGPSDATTVTDAGVAGVNGASAAGDGCGTEVAGVSAAPDAPGSAGTVLPAVGVPGERTLPLPAGRGAAHALPWPDAPVGTGATVTALQPGLGLGGLPVAGATFGAAMR
ncbi:hypothetical protein AB0L35_36585 [Streptomyces sp. NPDC052309]|uniref:Uncharacterized protein n=1 Tax=Streptomyces griseicoloratus TaxID=2752516 RepID=A0A926L5C9_9ACTN|nr:hypothetical protein [Streptomyces griseicoloratus]MBD0420696.1 hypothetical protein [Streptomyces griseicoloratus]